MTAALKAKKLTEYEDQQCSLCYLLKSTNKDVEFHYFDAGTYFIPDKKYVCKDCLDWINNIRELAIVQCEHPDKDIFKDLTFWWKPEKQKKKIKL